nr:hypothetical protein [Actinacidiphila yeochonensis]
MNRPWTPPGKSISLFHRYCDWMPVIRAVAFTSIPPGAWMAYTQPSFPPPVAKPCATQRSQLVLTCAEFWPPPPMIHFDSGVRSVPSGVKPLWKIACGSGRVSPRHSVLTSCRQYQPSRTAARSTCGLSARFVVVRDHSDDW